MEEAAALRSSTTSGKKLNCHATLFAMVHDDDPVVALLHAAQVPRAAAVARAMKAKHKGDNDVNGGYGALLQCTRQDLMHFGVDSSATNRFLECTQALKCLPSWLAIDALQTKEPLFLFSTSQTAAEAETSRGQCIPRRTTVET